MINRQKLIEAVEKEYYKFIDDDTEVAHNRAIYDVIEIIKDQPPADVPDTNVGEWIPCSEPPKATGNYLVTSKGCTWVAYWFNHTWWGIEKRCRWTDVEAWMPLPEPYKGVE